MMSGSAISCFIFFAAFVALVSYAFTFLSSAFAMDARAVDTPLGGRKIHPRPTPLWGGLGIVLAIVCALTASVVLGFLPARGVNFLQLAGFVAGILILLLGGMIDDRHPLPPFLQILFPIAAAIVVIASGIGIVHITNPTTHLGYSLVWQKIGAVSLPADLITFAWLLLATYAMKLLDGLDGLVSGMVVIGTGLVGALSVSPSYFQPAVAMMSAIVGGAYLGFLPRNVYPAQQFLGESGATIAGFSLGVLAILSSAKIAIALAVLAIPITDIALVVIGRIRRGDPWHRGDTSHLHFKLLLMGLSPRLAVFLLWGISLSAGLIALTLQTKGKIFLIVTLVLFTALLSYAAGLTKRRT